MKSLLLGSLILLCGAVGVTVWPHSVQVPSTKLVPAEHVMLAGQSHSSMAEASCSGSAAVVRAYVPRGETVALGVRVQSQLSKTFPNGYKATGWVETSDNARTCPVDMVVQAGNSQHTYKYQLDHSDGTVVAIDEATRKLMGW